MSVDTDYYRVATLSISSHVCFSHENEDISYQTRPSWVLATSEMEPITVEEREHLIRAAIEGKVYTYL